MAPVTIPEFEAQGLWYYYIELTWKNTREGSTEKLKNINTCWAAWCRSALSNQPEEAYLIKAMNERLEKDPNLSERDAKTLYKELVDSKKGDAVPMIVQRYDAYNGREASGLELYSEAKMESYIWLFKPILSFADSRHADLLEKYINEHPALASLKDKLAEVRMRPAPPPKPEPPFRLGTNTVIATSAFMNLSSSNPALTPVPSEEPALGDIPAEAPSPRKIIVPIVCIGGVFLIALVIALWRK